MPTACEPCPGKRKAMGHEWLIVRTLTTWDGSARVQACQLAGDGFVYLAFGKFCRYADRVLDRVGVRRSVGNDADAFHSEQRGSAVFGVVEAFLEIGECIARQQCADLTRDRALQRFFQDGAY